MARINLTSKARKTHPLANVSGQIGKTFVVKQYGNKIYLANFPAPSRVKPTQAQKKRRSKFGEAVQFAKAVLKDAKRKAAYERKLNGHRNAYQAALADYMKKD